MVHIINSIHSSIQQSINAITRMYPHLSQLKQLPVIYHNQHDSSVVPIISGGGSGHEPAHFGYVGDGMLAAAISGPIFVPPCAEHILETIRFLHRGKGVFVIIKNFDADIKEFSQAIHQARKGFQSSTSFLMMIFLSKKVISKFATVGLQERFCYIKSSGKLPKKGLV